MPLKGKSTSKATPPNKPLRRGRPSKNSKVYVEENSDDESMDDDSNDEVIPLKSKPKPTKNGRGCQSKKSKIDKNSVESMEDDSNDEVIPLKSKPKPTKNGRGRPSKTTSKYVEDSNEDD